MVTQDELRKRMPTNRIDWELLKNAYITHNLEPGREKPYSLKELAFDHKLNYPTVRNRASLDRWSDQLKQAAEEKAKAVLDETTKRIAHGEAEIRAKQYKMLNQLEGVLWNHFVEQGGIQFDSLTERQKVQILLEIGKAKRDAAGLPATTSVESGTTGLGDQREKQARLREFLDKVQHKLTEVVVLEAQEKPQLGSGEPIED